MIKKLLLVFIILSLFISCSENMPALDKIGITSKSSLFIGEAPFAYPIPKADNTDSITISWAPVENADYYKILRSTDNVNFEYLNCGPEETFYIDEMVDSNVIYYYKVVACSRLTSIPGDESNVVYSSLIVNPNTIEASKGEYLSDILITWIQPMMNNKPIADEYKIFVTNNKLSNPIHIDTVKATSSAKMDYCYSVKNENLGKDLFFTIKSKTGAVVCDDYNQVVGYTKVEGMPTAPEDLAAEDGKSKETITVRWKNVSDITDYEIYRSSNGGSESLIYPKGDMDTRLTREGDKCEFIDDDVNENIKYTYSVIGIIEKNNALTGETEVVKGTASKDDGFLLSPPVNPILKDGIDDGTNIYIELSFEHAVVYDNTFTYWVETNTGLNTQIIDNLDTSPSIKIEYNKTDPAKNNFEFEFYTKNLDGTESSRTPIVRYTEPEAPTNFEVCSNVYIEANGYNSNGVAPIILTWDKNIFDKSYVIQICDENGNELSREVCQSNSYIHHNDNKAGEYSYYKIKVVDKLGNTSEYSALESGYGAISANTFMYNFYAHLFKPWEYPTLHPEYVTGAKKSIWVKVSKAGLDSLGSASAIGKDGIAMIRYNAVAQGLGGRVTISFDENFSEAPFDFYHTKYNNYEMNVSMSKDGDVVDTIFEVGGMYPALIDFSNTYISDGKSKGDLTILQKHENGDHIYREVNSG